YWVFLAVKLLAIVMYSVLYFSFGVLASVGLNQMVPKLYESKKEQQEHRLQRSNARILVEIILNFAMIALVFFFVRKIVKLIPYPLNGVAGFELSRLKELQGGLMMATIFTIFQTRLIDKVNYL